MKVEQRAKWGKAAVISAACIALICSLAICVSSATALPFAHSEAEEDAGSGIIHIAVTIDCTAIDGSVKCVWQPINADDASVTAVMNQVLLASEDKTDRFAHEDYDMESLTDFLSDKEYTVSVYAAGAQEVGTTDTYTSASIGDASYASLEDGDAVYFTVTE